VSISPFRSLLLGEALFSVAPRFSEPCEGQENCRGAKHQSREPEKDLLIVVMPDLRGIISSSESGEGAR